MAAGAQGRPVFTASADARQILLNSFVEVTFTLEDAEGRNFQPPAFKDFTVVSGPNRSATTTFINGKLMTSSGYGYTLKPRRLGKLTIGPAGIQANGKTLYTEPLAIEVLDSRQVGGGAGEPYYLEAEVTPKSAWIGQQVTLNYKLYAESDVSSFNPIGESKYDGFYVEEIRRFDAPWQREIKNGRQYNTKTLKRMALYPQRSGGLEIAPYEVQLNIVAGDPGGLSMFMPRPVKRVPAATPPAVVEVKPLPLPAPADFSGAVGKYEAVFGVNLTDLTTDDALSVTIAIDGDGDLKRLQAPPVDFPDAFEVYPPKVLEERTYEESGRLIGRKVFEYLLVPRQAGEYAFTPAFVYFDTDSAKYAVVSADPVSVKVRQGQLNKAPAAPVEEKSAEILPLKSLGRVGAGRSLPLYDWRFGLGFALPILAVGSSWLFRRRRRRLEGIHLEQDKLQRARKIAVERLAKAKSHLDAGESRLFYDEIEKGLATYLGYKLGISPSAWSKAAARRRMEETGFAADMIAAFQQISQTCEMALFAAKDQGADMLPTYNAAVEIIERFEHA